ncbi:hypothetical protein WN944_001712 [Citrus x changshan-huyou]|uniref:Uncharacterized protein n=1 Tax=Citrus x changshan-huyou TaxID=2935761 RepID=A0AAP0MLF2_9ROSI
MADAVKVDRDHHPISNLNSRAKIGGFLKIFTELALDSALNVSVKGVTGGKKVYKIVLDGLKYQPRSLLLDDKNKCKDIESAKEMQAKMEEMQELINNVEPQNKTSVKPTKGSIPQKKKPNEGIKGSDLLKTKEKRILIRSRL